MARMIDTSNCAKPLVAPREARLGEAAATYIKMQAVDTSISIMDERVTEQLTIAQVQYHREGELRPHRGPNYPIQTVGASERIDQRKSKNDGNAREHSKGANSLGPEPIVQVSKEEYLEQPIHHAVDGKNIADTWRIETKTPKLHWGSKEKRLYGSECNV